jgi:hypothetical protein
MDGVDDVRWAALLGDLEAALELEDAADRDAEVADRVIAERGRLRLIDRLRPLLASERADLVVRTGGQQPLRGRLTGLGADWLTLAGDGPGDQEWLVPLARVTWLRGPGPESAEPGSEGVVAARLTLRIALRRLLRQGYAVTVTTVDGDVAAGRIATVGHDHLELQPVEGYEPSGLLIPIDAVAYVGRR